MADRQNGSPREDVPEGSPNQIADEDLVELRNQMPWLFDSPENARLADEDVVALRAHMPWLLDSPERVEEPGNAGNLGEPGNAGNAEPQVQLPSHTDIDALANTLEVSRLFGPPGEEFRGEINHLLFRRGIEDQRVWNILFHENFNLRTWEREIEADLSHHAIAISQIINQRMMIDEVAQQSEQTHRELSELISTSVTNLLIASGTSRGDSPDLFNSIMMVTQREYDSNVRRVLMLEERRDYMTLFNTVIGNFELTGIIDRRDRQPLAVELNLNESRRIRMFYEGICWKEANLRKLLDKASELNVGRVEQVIEGYFTQNGALREWLHEYFLDGVAPENPPTPEAMATLYRAGNRFLPVLNGIDAWCRATIESAQNGEENLQPLPVIKLPPLEGENIAPRV